MLKTSIRSNKYLLKSGKIKNQTRYHCGEGLGMETEKLIDKHVIGRGKAKPILFALMGSEVGNA